MLLSDIYITLTLILRPELLFNSLVKSEVWNN